jgi:hypothetical protein
MSGLEEVDAEKVILEWKGDIFFSYFDVLLRSNGNVSVTYKFTLIMSHS